MFLIVFDAVAGALLGLAFGLLVLAVPVGLTVFVIGYARLVLKGIGVRDPK